MEILGAAERGENVKSDPCMPYFLFLSHVDKQEWQDTRILPQAGLGTSEPGWVEGMVCSAFHPKSRLKPYLRHIFFPPVGRHFYCIAAQLPQCLISVHAYPFEVGQKSGLACGWLLCAPHCSAYLSTEDSVISASVWVLKVVDANFLACHKGPSAVLLQTVTHKNRCALTIARFRYLQPKAWMNK